MAYILSQTLLNSCTYYFIKDIRPTRMLRSWAFAIDCLAEAPSVILYGIVHYLPLDKESRLE